MYFLKLCTVANKTEKEKKQMIKSYNFTKKDEINSVSATPLQKVKGNVLHVTGAAITTRTDENGEEMNVGLLSSQEGTFSSISATAIKGLDLIIDYMTEEDSAVDVKVNVSKSNAGREFITLELV
jgi:hypothetical protein